MNTIFDKTTREQLLKRIQLLNENSRAQWGSMTVYQMLQHCILADEMYLGNKQYKRVLIGLLFGKIALRSILKNDAPMPRGAKTKSAFLTQKTSGDIEAAKQKWMAMLNEYEQFGSRSIVHWFFGRMTKEQVGQLVYKHADHHLRQFNC